MSEQAATRDYLEAILYPLEAPETFVEEQLGQGATVLEAVEAWGKVLDGKRNILIVQRRELFGERQELLARIRYQQVRIDEFKASRKALESLQVIGNALLTEGRSMEEVEAISREYFPTLVETAGM